MPASPAWSVDRVLLIDLDPPAGSTHRVVGLSGAALAAVRIGAAGERGSHRSLRLRPLVDPPGAFGIEGLLRLTPFLEADPDPQRTALRAFERRIGPRYYEYLLAQRFRYAATCAIDAAGIDPPGTCAELYSIDAATIEEADALDDGDAPPGDILAIYEECRDFIVPGSHRTIHLVPLDS